jgi:hypothetical protein
MPVLSLFEIRVTTIETRSILRAATEREVVDKAELLIGGLGSQLSRLGCAPPPRSTMFVHRGRVLGADGVPVRR